MIRNRFISACILLGLTISVIELDAQQYPGFTQQLYDGELFQPARVGIDGDYVAVRYRDQWTGMDKKYSPVTFLAGTDLTNTLKLKDDRIGLGFEMMGDRVFIQQSFFAHISFSYRLVETETLTFTSGIIAGILNQWMDYTDTRITDPFDLAILEGQPSATGFNGGLGLYLRRQSPRGHLLQVDLVMPQLFNSNLNFSGGSRYNPVPHLQFGMGYKLAGDNVVQLEPRLLLRGIMSEGAFNSTLDLGLRGFFLDGRYWAGLGVRLQGEAFHVAFGTTISDQFDLSVLMESQAQLGFSFELGLIYRLDKEPEANVVVNTESQPALLAPDASNTELENEASDMWERDFRVHHREALVAANAVYDLGQTVDAEKARVENFYKIATARTTSPADRLLLAEELEKRMIDIQDDLVLLENSADMVAEATTQLNAVYEQANIRGIKIPGAKSQVRQMRKIAKKAVRRADSLIGDFRSMEPGIQALQGNR